MPIEWAKPKRDYDGSPPGGEKPTTKPVYQAANDQLRQMVSCNLQDCANNVDSEASVDGLLPAEPITKQEGCKTAEESTELHAEVSMYA